MTAVGFQSFNNFFMFLTYYIMKTHRLFIVAEAVASLLWVAPRISHEISEFKIISAQLEHKYGKQYAETARMNQLPEPSRVSPKIIQKLSVNAPSKLLVEK
jgi:vacuolar protein sorting-associated protein IST1